MDLSSVGIHPHSNKNYAYKLEFLVHVRCTRTPATPRSELWFTMTVYTYGSLSRVYKPCCASGGIGMKFIG